jgi:hypothetical protein
MDDCVPDEKLRSMARVFPTVCKLMHEQPLRKADRLPLLSRQVVDHLSSLFPSSLRYFDTGFSGICRKPDNCAKPAFSY